MKRIALITMLLLGSCSPSDPKEKLISDFVQTIGSTKTDMDFRLISIAPDKNVTARDSLFFGYNQIKDKYEEGFNVDTLMASFKKQYENNPSTGKGARIYRILNQYYLDQDRVLLHTYACKYKIVNPLLKVEQEITRKFYFSPDDSKILTAD